MRRMAVLRALVWAFALASLAVIASGTVAAYNDYDNISCKWPNGSTVQVNWKWGPAINVSGLWSNGFRLGSNAWTNAGTKVRMGYSSSAYATADTYSAQDGLAGKTTYQCQWFDPGQMAEFHSYGNTSAYDDATGDYTAIKNVSLHEFGHGLALGHSNVTTAVMWKYVNWVTTPQPDDINGLNALYP